MSANRKLQTEVDRVLKKVEEGVEEFDDIFGKVYSVSQQSLKEKYESDLKKEIKKLQRLRDQIKSWLGNTDIKDKSALIDARKLIEVKMEEFKICEKETKTKSFSKEGSAKEEKLDPREVEREEKKVWIQSVVERIEEVVESLESELERVSNLKGKGKNKEQMEKLEARIVTNRWHISKLEQIQRLLDNDTLEPSKLDSIKEELDYYLECIDNEEAIVGMESDEYNIYEELQLDLLSLGGPGFGNKGEDDEEKESDSKLGEESSPMIEPLSTDEISIPALPTIATNSNTNTSTLNAAKSKKAISTASNTTNTSTSSATGTGTGAAATPSVTTTSSSSATTSNNTSTTTSVASSSSSTTTPATTTNKLASVISSVGTKTAASVVAGTNAQAKISSVGVKSVVPPATQKPTPTAASIVASNIPNQSTVAGAKTQPTPVITAAKIVAGEKKPSGPTPVQAKPAENRKDTSGPTPTITSPPLAGSWAHAATSGQRIGLGTSTSPSPQQTTPKQSTTVVPPVIPPVESLPQAVTEVSETASKNSKSNEITNTNSQATSTNTSSSTTTTTSTNNNNNNVTNTSTTIPTSNNNNNNVITAAAIVASNNNSNTNTTNTNNNTNATTTANNTSNVIPTSTSLPGTTNTSQPKTLESENQGNKSQVNANLAMNTKTTSSPMLNSVSNSNEPPSLNSLSLEDNNKGSNGIPPLHRLTPVQQAQQSPATQPSMTLSPGPSQGLPPPHSNPRPNVTNSNNFGGSNELQTIANMLKMSMTHLPPVDVERKTYVPRIPYNGQIPPSFPTQPLSIVDSPALFERLPMDTLFLAFYYQQGSHQQYLAARQLKKHSWRFHKKYMTWFQRHEEPKTTTNDYEEGTYVYFDYESGWCQRIKSEFKFEYAYLEDELPQAGNPVPNNNNNNNINQQQQQQQAQQGQPYPIKYKNY